MGMGVGYNLRWQYSRSYRMMSCYTLKLVFTLLTLLTQCLTVFFCMRHVLPWIQSQTMAMLSLTLTQNGRICWICGRPTPTITLAYVCLPYVRLPVSLPLRHAMAMPHRHLKAYALWLMLCPQLINRLWPCYAWLLALLDCMYSMSI